MNEDRQQRIAHRAYQIWEQAGRPHGLDAQHWQQAQAALAAEEAPAAGTHGAKTKKGAAGTKAGRVKP